MSNDVDDLEELKRNTFGQENSDQFIKRKPLNSLHSGDMATTQDGRL